VRPRRSIKRVSNPNAIFLKSESASFEPNFEFVLIDPKSTHFHNFLAWAVARSSQEGLNAQNQLAQAEWLDQIVVGSKLQTFNPLAGFTSGGQDEDRKGGGVGDVWRGWLNGNDP
jgi:hypothetical protein